MCFAMCGLTACKDNKKGEAQSEKRLEMDQRAQGYLADQSGALIVEGYVVDVQELFDRDQANEEGEQMSLVCEILLTSVSCVGMNHLLKETFSN